MKGPYRTVVMLFPWLPLFANAQFSFTNASHLKNTVTNSGGCMGVTDMNGDGLDDLCILHGSRVFMVEYQNLDGSFVLMDYDSISNSDQWGWALGDLDGNGHKDMICGGFYNGVKYMRIDAPGNAQLTELDNGWMYMQCNNIVDIDNDGHNDFWACHDNGAPRQWINDGSGNLSYADIIDYTTDPPSDMSGNYGSVWIDFDNDGDLDLYIAKCKQGVTDPNDPRRWNRLFVNDGNGGFTDRAEEFGLQVRGQSWMADFADIDNDGDLDMVVANHDATVQLYENDGSGHFTNITTNSGLGIPGFFLQCKFVDLDNDGYVDLLMAGGIERLWRNNGDRTFTLVNGVFPASKAMHGFATGDLNNDGSIDVFANYGSGYVTPDMNNPDRLWLNNGNDNHWVGVRLQGTTSNPDAIGARVTITGPWGAQIREVRAGESYGIVTTSMCHFGLGPETVIPTMSIRWPSGLVETFSDIAADQVINVVEGICISPTATISTPDGLIVCENGDPITLVANEGYDHAWSTGATSQSIEVDIPGTYSVTIDDGQGCTARASVFVRSSPDQTPTVSISGDTRSCEGDEVVLTSSEAFAYSWSNGAVTQSISVTQSGTYAVTTQGNCDVFTSDPIEVEMLDGPDAPVADDVTIPAPGTATLFATGDDIRWYDVPNGGTPIGLGNFFETPVVTEHTPFWASATLNHPGTIHFGGPLERDENGQFHPNTDFYPLFTAYEAFTIRSVKVYANGTAPRTIALIDRADGSSVASGTFSIPDGESRVDLAFEVPAPGDYALRCVGGNPQLWRDGLGSDPAYPYPLGDVGSITSSNVVGNNATALYYFFYDWEVQTAGQACEGPRTEVAVNVGTVGVAATGVPDGALVWPNPASEHIIVSVGGARGTATVDMLDLTGRVVLPARNVHGAHLRLNVNGLAQGDYLVRISHAGGRSVHRIQVL